MSSTYEDWKMVFAYAQQKTVIDVACDVTVSQNVSTKPDYCGETLLECNEVNPCDDLGA